jgi:putative ABC transport system ATP-binding protein
MASTILRVAHVSKIYRMDGVSFTALADVSLSVREGEFVAIIGPSGSGKSTLMHLIGALDRPTDGTVAIQDEDISKADDRHLAHIRNRSIGFVFQQFNLLRKTSALANVELPLVYGRVDRQERQKLAKKLLEEVGLGEKLENFPSQLSGGQQQRVAIARALVTNPKILLADEPTGNLDSKSGAEIMKLFENLHTKGSTIILVTHDEHVAAHAKRIVRIADGKIIEDKSNKTQIHA